MAKDFLLGPVLSFRGLGENDTWKVTALIGIKPGAPEPLLQVEGRDCPAPTQLLATRKARYLRYDLSCQQQKAERRVGYGVAGGPVWHFTVPGKHLAPRMAYVSCNGFSDPTVMRSHVSQANAVWEDLLYSHDKLVRIRNPGPGDKLLDKEQLWHEVRIHDKGLQRFHLLLMGGDQIYFDSIWHQLDELKKWIGLSRDQQLNFSVSKVLDEKIAAYYFDLYAERWLPPGRRPWGSEPNRDAADAMARIPTVMMWDDHDIFDGWGSYTPEMQRSPLFQRLFHHARRAFWVFQMQQVLDDLPALTDSTPTGFSQQDPLYAAISWKQRLAGDPLALPLLDGQPGYTWAFRAGPLAILVADLRTERSRTQVFGSSTWSRLKEWLNGLEDKGEFHHPGTRCQHLLLMSSVPVVHPKLTLAETALDGFGQDHVLDSSADDLKDHWSHDDHEGERTRLLEVLFDTARSKKVRVTLLSGDVHVAARGGAFRRDQPASEGWGLIPQFTASAVVHPSLKGWLEQLFLATLNKCARTPQQAGPQYQVEMMLFPGHNQYVMPARNWLALELEEAHDAKLWATWRCEGEKMFSNHLHTVPPVR
ncbi:alkaline phosphatase family protein [Metapseudomonas lalkuanensis]|uniref:Alkaline phosphatase family protein n=1 Tax=Metapseudomonas lalkuanensis TaxID=2604832 RepID=A0A5J6QPF4_9GAMM|nr:alkaline phosphatase family protein [Pseudomonas lalkuanensis]QEY64187.1 alkaline phosphatase family protein [Pseudomonas lalkuanensis]